MAEGRSKSSIYNILKTFKKRKTTERKVGSRRRASVMTKKKRDRLKSIINHKR
jgi:transposase